MTKWGSRKRKAKRPKLSEIVEQGATDLEAAVVGGALAGAAVGSMAGPTGTIIGGLVGSGAGLIAGGVIEEEHLRSK